MTSSRFEFIGYPSVYPNLKKLTDYFLILFLVRDETDCVMQ